MFSTELIISTTIVNKIIRSNKYFYTRNKEFVFDQPKEYEELTYREHKVLQQRELLVEHPLNIFYSLSDNPIWSEVSVMTIEHRRAILAQWNFSCRKDFPMKVPADIDPQCRLIMKRNVINSVCL